MEIWDHNANFDEAFEMEIWDHNANFGEASNIEPERLPMTNQNKGLKHNEPMRIGRNCAWSTSSEGKRVWPRRSWFSLACYWCKSGVWRDFSWPITEHDEATPMQSCDTLDSQLEIFQIWNSSFDLKNGINRALFWQNPLQETLVIKFTCRWSNPRTHLFQSVHLLPSLATACWDWMRGEFTGLNPLALKSD